VIPLPPIKLTPFATDKNQTKSIYGVKANRIKDILHFDNFSCCECKVAKAAANGIAEVVCGRSVF
jgi:hypothetical protein